MPHVAVVAHHHADAPHLGRLLEIDLPPRLRVILELHVGRPVEARIARIAVVGQAGGMALAPAWTRGRLARGQTGGVGLGIQFGRTRLCRGQPRWESPSACF